jgi:hypothetical protein
MTPADAIAMLDRSLSRNGQDITLRRVVPNASNIDVTVRAFVRGYQPEEIVGGVQYGDSLVILSPSSLLNTAWPDPLVKRLDKVVVDGRLRTVENAWPVNVNGEIVRINLQVRG